MRHLKGLFVTGTDTGVGKTTVSAALMHRYRLDAPLRYWKPIQTGIDESDDTSDVAHLARCQPRELFQQGIRLPRPVSPHLAARWARTTIEIPPLLHAIAREPHDRSWIVEGAGGVLVPINDEGQTMADLMVGLDLPIIVVARTTLGTINHTLLTLDALRRRQLHVAGVVMVGEQNSDNTAAIEQYGSVAVLGHMPRLEPLTAEALETWSRVGLDPEGRLLPRLQ
ncbi:MAG: dethiobiotin synthase [Acidobacteriota bacterium]